MSIIVTIRRDCSHHHPWLLPLAKLFELHSYCLSVPVTEAVDPTTDLAKYQSIDTLLSASPQTVQVSFKKEVQSQESSE